MKEKILLHICCAVCGAYLVEALKDKFEIVLYYYNPNIWPEEEFKKRLEAVKSLAQKYNLELIVGEYENDLWLKVVKGYESEPEGGKRCLICFEMRLKKSAELSRQKNIKIFTTTLGISPYKADKTIDQIGEKIAQEMGLKFLTFSEIEKALGEEKQILWQKTRKLAKELNFYHQKYCGCQFSLRGAEKNK